MILRAAALLLLAVRASCAPAVVEETVRHAGVEFRVVRLAPERVRLVWKDENDRPYSTFDRVQAAFAKRGKSVSFLMNAGIFESGGVPSGLLIEHGKTLRPLNLADAPGNFFLKPNGVCAFGKSAAIVTSAAWQAHPSPASFAIQSGPMLLIAGKRHSAFRENSASVLPRNGVGIDRRGQLVFAITAPGQRVNFWNFAGLFLRLGCADALFLDGTISQMSVNPAAPAKSKPFAAMFIVAE